jgi:hypothetical protein
MVSKKIQIFIAQPYASKHLLLLVYAIVQTVEVEKHSYKNSFAECHISKTYAQ